MGPCPGHFVCLCELDCVSLCVCLQKGVGPSFLSLPWKAPKSGAGDSSAPPAFTWSSLARAPREKFSGEMCVWGSRQRGLGQILLDFPAALLGNAFRSAPVFFLPSGPPGLSGEEREGEGWRAGGHCRGEVGVGTVGGALWARGRGGGGEGGSGEMQTKCWPRAQSRKTDSRGSLERGSL